MKNFVFLVFCVVSGVTVQAQLPLPEMTDLIHGGEMLSSIFLLSETPTVASYADKLELILQGVVRIGRVWFKVLTEIMGSLNGIHDNDMNFKELIQMVQEDIQIVEWTLDHLEQNARLRNVMLKAIAECAVPHQTEMLEIKDRANEFLSEFMEIQRDAFMDLMAAGQLITEQVRELLEIGEKLLEAVSNDDRRRLIAIYQENWESIQRNVRIIQKTYKSASGGYNDLASASVAKLVEALKSSQTRGRRVVEAIDDCMKPQSDTNGLE